MSHFLHNAAKVAVPIGTSAVDENSAHKGISYNPDKSDKFVIWFYAVISSCATYLHSMMDSCTGNTTPESAPVAYCRLIPQLQSAYNKVLGSSESYVDGNSPSAQWV